MNVPVPRMIILDLKKGGNISPIAENHQNIMEDIGNIYIYGVLKFEK